MTAVPAFTPLTVPRETVAVDSELDDQVASEVTDELVVTSPLVYFTYDTLTVPADPSCMLIVLLFITRP